MLKENLIEGMKIDRACVFEEVVARVQAPSKMQGRAVLLVVAELDEGLPERVELLQRIECRLLRAEILDRGKLLSGTSNARYHARVSNKGNECDDDQNRGQGGDGREQNAAAQVSAGARAAGTERGAI